MNQLRLSHEQGQFRQEIFVGKHHLIAGVGVGLDGSPHDLLVSALDACTAITTRMYAKRNNWPLESADRCLVHKTLLGKIEIN